MTELQVRIIRRRQNTNPRDTFKAIEQGYLGIFIDVEPVFYYPPATTVGKLYFDLSNTNKFPQVDIQYGYQDLNPAPVNVAIESEAKGLVMAGMGAGWTDAGSEATIWRRRIM